MLKLQSEFQQRLENNPFFKHIGFEFIKEEGSEIVLKLPLKQDLLNTNKTLHGGVHASILDAVQTVVLRNLYKCSVSALNLDVHYFAPSVSGNLFARAKVLQQGYKLATVEAKITDEQQQLIAKGTGVYKIAR
ncbi:PaaI family thioesterase [Bacillus sp. FJAT-29814]|uniref:PaaI family thioesterase n=1 Tax=Bacillus sp. FJAT-29814 TaxID=1729688 RepID=UPI00082B4414|nr:PaaI family thioesterase [Bacillus sp. FJAT-29814]